MALTKTQIAARKQWVKALRSGKYQQAIGRLRRDGGYCCLGVACDVSGLGWWEGGGAFGADFYRTKSGEAEGWSLPYEAINRLGFDRNDEATFILRNDNNLDTFLDIADTIELLTLADTEGL